MNERHTEVCLAHRCGGTPEDFQKIMRSGTMPMEWGHSLDIPLYKEKWDA